MRKVSRPRTRDRDRNRSRLRPRRDLRRSRPRPRPRLKKTGLETRLETETKSRDSITVFYIQDFWATCACPENFHCIKYTFYIQDFWTTCACPETQSVPWIHYIEYIFFIIQNFEQLALALKNRVSLKFFTALRYFYFFSHSICPTKQDSMHPKLIDSPNELHSAVVRAT